MCLDVWIAAALAAANLILLGPWLFAEYSGEPWNNGYNYIATARMFRDLAWTWNPLQYGGAPFRYLYPPLFHVFVVMAPPVSLGRAFHLIAGAVYAMVPVCLYVLARQLFSSRVPAVFAAVAYSALPSPAYAMEAWHTIARPYGNAPWAYIAMVAYDEGPHALGLALALLAVAAAWRDRRLAASMASVLTAGVLLTNWPALIGFAFMITGLAIARLREKPLGGLLATLAGMVGAGYGISAFWMTPGYFVSSVLLNRIVLRHTYLAAPWNGITWTGVAVALIVCGVCCLRRISRSVALAAVWTALAGLVVVTYTMAGNSLLPLPHRYMLEFTAGFTLLAASVLATLPARTQAIAAVCLILAGCAVSWRFLADAWTLQPKPEDPRQGVAYRTAAWLRNHTGGARVVAAGELGATLNLWSDVPQIGGDGQDVSNFLMPAVEHEVALGCGPGAAGIAELWMRAVNAPFLVVHGAGSREYFHWYTASEKFAALPAVWNDSSGNTVRRVPEFEPRDAVVVDLAALSRLPRLTSISDENFLRAYVEWAAGKRPAALRWKSADEAEIDADLQAGEAILIKVNNDPGWRVSGASIADDPVGFQLIQAPSGRRRFTLRFGASWDTWLGRAITVLTIVLLVLRVPALWIAVCAVVPAGVAWAILMSSVAPNAAVAERAFAGPQAPLINPSGIVPMAGGAISIYGTHFGGPSDRVRVWVNDGPLIPAFRGRNQINVFLPPGAPASARIGVEVNGCRGNEFVAGIR